MTLSTARFWLHVVLRIAAVAAVLFMFFTLHGCTAKTTSVSLVALRDTAIVSFDGWISSDASGAVGRVRNVGTIPATDVFVVTELPVGARWNQMSGPADPPFLNPGETATFRTFPRDSTSTLGLPRVRFISWRYQTPDSGLWRGPISSPPADSFPIVVFVRWTYNGPDSSVGIVRQVNGGRTAWVAVRTYQIPFTRERKTLASPGALAKGDSAFFVGLGRDSLTGKPPFTDVAWEEWSAR